MFRDHRSGYQSILLIVAFYCAMAIAVTGNPVFFLYDDRPSSMVITVCTLPILFWYMVVLLRMMAAGRPQPWRRLVRYTRLNRAWILRSALLIVLIVVWASAFTILKMNIPNWVPYYADPWLARFDRALLGTDAWRLTHAFIGPKGTVVLDRIYAVWFAVLIAFKAWIVGSRNVRFQVQCLLSFVLTWLVVGLVLATALSSVGPCFYQHFYGRPDFAPLMATLHGNPGNLMALDGMAYLEAMYGKTAYANGISAMPSMHVAMVAWFVLVTWAGTRNALLRAAIAAYAVLICIGSVHLGWHYAADGLVSIIVTPVIWYLVRLFLNASAGQRSVPAKLALA